MQFITEKIFGRGPLYATSASKRSFFFINKKEKKNALKHL